MARIHHLALYTVHLESLRRFYVQYFGAISGEKYVNERKGFASYFLRFESGAQLEIMEKVGVFTSQNDPLQESLGYTHLAIEVGEEVDVCALTERMRTEGVPILGEPRRTGDGYFESIVADPDGNRIELVARKEQWS